MYKLFSLALIASFLTPQIANACNPIDDYPPMLTRDMWSEIKREINRKKRKVNEYDVSGYIGFLGDCKPSANGRVQSCVWLDIQNCKRKIKAKFRDDELVTITKSGF